MFTHPVGRLNRPTVVFVTDKKNPMPERTCIVTREVKSPDAMIRFVAGPEGQVVPDLKGKLPGRGVWVTRDRDLVAQAVAKKAFARGLQAPVKAEENLPDQVDELLAQAALGALSMANKAGQVITGADQVDDHLRRGPRGKGGALGALHALDGAEDGLRKLQQAALAGAYEGLNKKGRARVDGAENATLAPLPLYRLFTCEEMSLALGANHVIHASIINGHAGVNLQTRLAQLNQYRRTGP
ncbi:MAG: RNA-binding protein [Pseudomonadota bacterium]